MRTPEEILRAKVNSDPKIDPETWQGSNFEADILEAMTDYAQQEAEAFVEWIYRNNWEQINIGIYANPQEGEATTAQLYKLYTLFKTEQKDGK